ncbi:MAG TPA: hypothetical protein VGV60_02705 [Candidatus Polarisedimenticolia bacterium]|nr:hypothetical protein [Candidatus Polarisedimenticolia bacterium]
MGLTGGYVSDDFQFYFGSGFLKVPASAAQALCGRNPVPLQILNLGLHVLLGGLIHLAMMRRVP